MPSWQPNWDDVSFDHAAAGGASDALRAAARRLADSRADRLVSAAASLESWSGPRCDAWLDAHARLVADDEMLTVTLLAAARAIDTAADLAMLEQRRRVEARELWRRLSAAEARAESASAATDSAAGPSAQDPAQAPMAW